MTKSTITREQQRQILIDTAKHIISRDNTSPYSENLREIARIALSAMDSEPVAWREPFTGRCVSSIFYQDGSSPLDHGYEPLYSAPQDPVAEVLSNRTDNETSTIDRALPAGTQLYRHAQPAPVVPDDVLKALQKVARIRLDMDGFDGDRRGIADCLCDAEEALIEVVNRRAVMLHAGDTVRDLSTPVDPQVAEYEQNVMQDGNSPAIPDGYVMVPMRLTAENGAKGVLSGEFSETKFVNCPECFGDDECETCDGSGRIEIKVPVSWTTIKDIWIKGVEHFAAAPQEVKGE